jgi:methionyl-tRNA formyltransferase
MNDSLEVINRVLLLGGGNLLFRLAEWSKMKGFEVLVITSPRHAQEIVDDLGVNLKDKVENAGIKIVVLDSIESDDARIAVGSVANTFAISIGAAWIFKKLTIDNLFQGKLFNLHGTRLPQNRGGGGFSWQIMMGNRFGFCLIHRVEEGIDTGDIMLAKEFLYPYSCRIPKDFISFYEKQNFIFVTSIIDAGLQINQLKPISQPEYLSTYWPRLHTPSHGWIDWSWSVTELERFICAFDDPYSGAQTFLNGRLVRIKKVSANFQDGYSHPAQIGFIYRISKGWICVACKGGAIIIEELFGENGDSFLDKVQVGDALFTPFDFLEKKNMRVIYSPTEKEPKFKLFRQYN